MLPANTDMHLVEKFLTVRQNYEYALRRRWPTAASYDVVMCDCPPSVGAIPYTAMTAANLLLIPPSANISPPTAWPRCWSW